MLSNGATVIADDVTNQGSVQLTDATIDFAGDFVNHGTVTATDSTLDAFRFTNSGTFDLTDVTVEGLQFNNDSDVISQGLVRFKNTVIGSGDFSGNGIVIFDGEFRPGNVFEDPTIVEFTGGVEFLSSSSRLRLTIQGDDNSDPLNPQYDALEVDGEVYIGGRPELSLILDISDYTPTAGDTFDLITAGNLVSAQDHLIFIPGFFSSLPGDLEWRIIHDYVDNKVIAEIVTPYSADFDGDGDVDQDDLTDPVSGWQARNGVDLSGLDFLAWQQQLGSGVASLSGASGAVPEPCTLLLFIATGIFLGSQRQGRFL